VVLTTILPPLYYFTFFFVLGFYFMFCIDISSKGVLLLFKLCID
jgi:hypothetical protein